jgi:tRNA (cmo5U34)-methyltransferase
MANHSISPHEHVHDFDEERARRYDQTARQTLPGYEELHNMSASLLHVELDADAHVLVVGAGTGMEILTLAEQHPQWRFTGVDPSAEMLALTRERLYARGWTDRVRLHVGLTHELSEAEHYDAATCLLVIHHLPDEAEQRQLLLTIARRLKRRAPLIVAEMLGDPTSPRFQRLLAAWKYRQLSFGAPAEEVEQRARTLPSVVRFPSEEHLRGLLSTAGFVNMERFFTAYFYSAWVARLHL